MPLSTAQPPDSLYTHQKRSPLTAKQAQRDPDEEGDYMAFEQLMAEAQLKKDKTKNKDKDKKKDNDSTTPPDKDAGTATGTGTGSGGKFASHLHGHHGDKKEKEGTAG